MVWSPQSGLFFCLILHIKLKGVDGNADDIKPRHKKNTSQKFSQPY